VPPLGIPFTIAGLLWCLAFFSSMYLPTTLVAEVRPWRSMPPPPSPC
jgi:hypothetical protein